MTISQLFVHHVWVRSLYFRASSGMMKFSGWKENFSVLPLLGSMCALGMLTILCRILMLRFLRERRRTARYFSSHLSLPFKRNQGDKASQSQLSLTYESEWIEELKVKSFQFDEYEIRWNSLQKTWVLFSLFHFLHTHKVFTFSLFLPLSLSPAEFHTWARYQESCIQQHE